MALRLVYTRSVVQEALSAQDDSEELANRALLCLFGIMAGAARDMDLVAGP